MPLTWHIVRKDIRRFWAMSLLLVILIALESWCGVRLLAHEGEFDYTLFSRVGDYAGLLMVVQIVVVALFTATLIHEDGLTGSSAFWMTRPISNRRLLIAKFLTLLILAGFIPAFAMMPWWIHAGWGLGEISRGAVIMMASSGTIALFATPFALVTANLGRFLLAIFLCFLGFASMTTLKTSWHGFDTSMPALSESRAIIASCLLFSTSIAVILIQLRPRRTKLANGVLYTGYTVAIVSLLAWPWPFPNRTSDPESPATSQIAARPVSIRPVAAASRQNSTYQVNFELSGIPPNHYLTGGTDKKHRLVWPDSEPKVWIKTPSPFRIPLSTAGVLLNLETAHHAVPRSASASYNVTMPPEFTERSVSTPVLYEMGGNFLLHAPHVLGEVPLEPGAVLEKNANRTRVVGIQDKVGHRIVALVNSRPSRYHSYNTTLPQPFGLGAHHFQPIYPGAFTHYLVNRRLNRLFESASTELHGERVRYCTIAFVKIHWREVSFKIADESATSSGDLGADDDLTLASIASEVIASFKRTVVFPASAFLPPVSN